MSQSKSSDQVQILLNRVLVLLIALISFFGLYILRDPAKLAVLGWTGLISLGVVGIWRWSWFGLHIVRWLIYQHLVFPRWRRRADAIPVEELPPLCLLIPTFKEKPWITERVFRSIGLETRQLGRPVTIVTVSSGPEEDAAIVEALRLGDPDLSSVRIVHAIDPGDGKRKALSSGLRVIAELGLPSDAVIALMDGDSEFTPGTLRRSLPFFRLFPKLGALTTDEIPVVVGSYLFSEWFHLRFAQRHYQMCSISLSKKVLCLTGRFSLYRAEAALHPDFANQLESDMLDDWLWGRFKFLSGDDKTTWYWMLKNRNYDMIYLPDVTIYSIESISGSLANRMYQNMRRWFGNMLRNGNRALALGPGKLGLFVTLCLLDQRTNMWTSLISPCLLLIALLQRHWLPAGILLCWMIFSRSLTLVLIFWGRESFLKPIHLPILLLSQWSSALIKIWTQMNLAQQRWFNRGDRKLSVGGNPWVQRITKNTSRFLLFTQAFTFGVILCSLIGVLDPVQTVNELWVTASKPEPVKVTKVSAAAHGVIANDDQDDSAALQSLIDQLAEKEGIYEINLPIGEIDLFHPVDLNRSSTVLSGQGIDRTILSVKFNQSENSHGAVLRIAPQDEAANEATTEVAAGDLDIIPTAYTEIHDVHLQGFTLQLDSTGTKNQTLDGIVLKHVNQASLKQIHIEQAIHYGIVLNSTQNVVVEYVNIGSATKGKKLVQINTTDTKIRGSSIS